jgi:hypothetical protein
MIARPYEKTAWNAGVCVASNENIFNGTPSR